jgi:phage baseplate assembly protein W
MRSNNILIKHPFCPEEYMKENSNIENSSIAESIAQNIMLLIITKKGENRFNPNYGNKVWDLEFESSITSLVWEKTFIDSVLEQIKEYELRIYQPIIKIKIDFVEHTHSTKKYSEMKKRARIIINAKLVETDENFNFETELFLSPMSID